MTEGKMTFFAMQDKFLKDLSYFINTEKDKCGYSDVDYVGLRKVLQDALDTADQLRWHQKRGALKVVEK